MSAKQTVHVHTPTPAKQSHLSISCSRLRFECSARTIAARQTLAYGARLWRPTRSSTTPADDCICAVFTSFFTRAHSACTCCPEFTYKLHMYNKPIYSTRSTCAPGCPTWGGYKVLQRATCSTGVFRHQHPPETRAHPHTNAIRSSTSASRESQKMGARRRPSQVPLTHSCVDVIDGWRAHGSHKYARP